MISGANDKELELATARADILLMCGSETIKIIDKEIDKYKNIIDELEKYLKEPNITYTYDATDFGIEKIECISVKDALNKLKALKEGK